MDASARQVGTASNRYVVIGRLAGGGMADIFLARSTSETGISRYVVLKRVLAERSRDPHFAALFLDEARIAAQLQHPNIAQVLDVGKLAGSYFFTMEYVHGEDVRHILHRSVSLKRELAIGHVLSIATGALAGLHHAHTRTTATGAPLGVVHRDVSPSNIMVSYEGGVKLLDFGVATAAERTSESSAGTVKGKVAYASPEQCRGEKLDRRSDIYSLGIVMWEMLIGRRLYKLDSDYATMTAIVSQPVRRPGELRAGVSPALDAIVMTALAKDREQRFATAAAMIDAIEQLAANEHHVLSMTGLGRLIGDLFGHRPEPWIGLTNAETEVTVTGAAVDDLDTSGAMAIQPSGAHAVADTALAAQLDRAPQIGRPEGVSSTIPPMADATVSDAPVLALNAPAPASASTPMQMPAPRAGTSSAGSASGVAAITPAQTRSRRAIAIAAAAIVAVVVVIAFVAFATRSGSRVNDARAAADAAVAPAAVATKPTTVPPPSDAALPIDAAVAAEPAAVLDAAVAPVAVPVDAAIVPVQAPPVHVPHPQRPVDPCKSQRYRDENPLKCQ